MSTVHEQAKMTSHPRDEVDGPSASHSLSPNEPKAANRYIDAGETRRTDRLLERRRHTL
jgi:hypothetical protein